MLFSDTDEQRLFAEVLAESAPRGLLDAVVIHKHTLVGDWHLEDETAELYLLMHQIFVLIGIATNAGWSDPDTTIVYS